MDMQNEYEYQGLPLRWTDYGYRHCVGLQNDSLHGRWVLRTMRTVECQGYNLQQNGYICEYSKCYLDHFHS